MVTENIIQELEALYQKLMTKDMTPDEEAQAKVELLKILSSIKAHSEIQQGNRAKNVLAQTNSLKNMLLDWDPYGSAWFKEEKTLVDSVYNLLAAVKGLFLEAPKQPDNAVINNLQSQINELGATLGAQIAALQNEIATIKNSVIKLATAVKNQLENRPVIQSTPTITPAPTPNSSTQRPVSLSVPKETTRTNNIEPSPIPITKEDLEDLAPKPITLPKPVPVSLEPEPIQSQPEPIQTSQLEPIQIPSSNMKTEESAGPQPIPLDEMPGPSPIPLSDPDLEEPIPLDTPSAGAQRAPHPFGSLMGGNREASTPSDKEQLFNIFAGGNSDASTGQELELEVAGTGSAELSTSTDTPADAETLYQELISLEGKRYSIERSIRDLKTDRENGILSDQEYKQKLSGLLEKLQKISKRIDAIRETLD
ncbi:MAG: hypothetical protein ACTSRS_03405 [Candidatus Helarchaeota archaeon]